MAISRHVRMISGSTERVKSSLFLTVGWVLSSWSTVGRSRGRLLCIVPWHRSEARTGLVVDTAQELWQHSTRKREGAQSRGGPCNTNAYPPPREHDPTS